VRLPSPPPTPLQVFGYAFCDFGDAFVCVDTNGEEPSSAMVASIDNSQEETVVTCLDEARHGLEDGDYVSFTEVGGMDALNAAEARPVKVTGPYTFTVTGCCGMGKHTNGGLVHQVKQPKTIAFQSLRSAIANPEAAGLTLSDFGKFDRPMQLHYGVQALHVYATETGSMPAPVDAAAAAKVIAIARKLAADAGAEVEFSERLLINLASGSRGEISPLCAVFGGVVGQEVMKAASGKFNPLQQWLYFDAEEALPGNGEAPLAASEVQPRGSRHDGQAAVLGWTLQERLGSLKYLLVGAGASGCEMLKNWALMGVGTGEGGSVVVTDPDTIEKSNLNRQFLFRPWDVTKAKSETAAAMVRLMNPACNVSAQLNRLGAETEDIFDDAFWEGLSGVCNALDNVQARLYVDQRCVYYQKSLLESGTLGAKGNVQVVVPKMTESYGSSRDPPEKSIPICTLKSFPNEIGHTIQWARDLFEGYYVQSAGDVNSYLSQADYLQALERQPGVRRPTLEALRTNLCEKPISVEECITWARQRFEELYHNAIAQLLHNFPLDQVTSSGAPFWSGPKRAPAPIVFDGANELHLDFITAAANLRAFNYGLKGSTDRAFIRKIADSAIVPEFVPKSGVKIHSDPKEEEKAKQEAAAVPDDDDVCDELQRQLPTPSSLAGYRMVPCEFEKDDDTNFHIDFITAASNLRAENYKITLADKLKTKQIAGKIIPAIATTTAMVTGLVCLEMLKLAQGETKKIEDYKNAFCNLALPFVSFSEPIAAPKKEVAPGKMEWTLWDRFDINEGRDITLKEFLELFEQRHGLEVTMISSGVSILYSFFTNAKKLKERMVLPMSQLVTEVSKTEFKPKQTYVTFEICCNLDDEDVEVPYVRYRFRAF
jgi:ubiquitin-activating enzyme E1